MSALLIVPAAIRLALPAHADPGGDDAEFLATLGQVGISYAAGDRAVAVGRGICDQLDHGQSATDVVKSLTDANPGFTPNNAAKFTVVATGAYCPKYLGDGSGEAANGGDQSANGGGRPVPRGGQDGSEGVIPGGGD